MCPQSIYVVSIQVHQRLDTKAQKKDSEIQPLRNRTSPEFVLFEAFRRLGFGVIVRALNPQLLHACLKSSPFEIHPT